MPHVHMDKDQLALPETGFMQFYWLVYFFKEHLLARVFVPLQLLS